MTVSIQILGPDDTAVLSQVAPDVFDNEVDPDLAREFLHDPRHHIAVAMEEGMVVGFASAVHYVHPDKPPELWINEVGVAPTHHSRGIGKQVLSAILAVGRTLGCREAWVLTDRSNVAAMRLYHAVGGGEASDHAMITFDLDSATS